MKLKNLIKIIRCKMFICCKSSCSLNDTNNDGIPDTIIIEQELNSQSSAT